MRRVTDPLQEMGATVRELGRPDRLPLEIRGGTLRSIHHRSPKASAQIKSAVLLAGLSGGVPVSVWEPGQSRDHSERMLSALGARVEAGGADGGWLVRFEPPAGPLSPLHFAVPGDPSSAAFPAALALLADAGELRLEGVDLNPTRTGFFRAVERMGARISRADEREQGGEPVGDLVVHASTLRGIEVTGEEVPSMIDELPVLAALAARAEGETTVRGAEELRAKESDRIAALVSNLRALGVEAEEFPDGFAVRGSDRPLAGHVRTHHDHRIAMAFGVLAALPGNRITIEAPEVVDVSFPGYWELLRSLASATAG
jgi:3-phosphoshikimate 1-carboxyvinyltransferase